MKKIWRVLSLPLIFVSLLTGCNQPEDCGALGDEDDNGASDCEDDACKDLAICDLCGNSALDAGEDCDGNVAPFGASCVGEGFDTGELACNADCTFDTTGCVTFCGDGILNNNEPCDGADLGLNDCLSLGFGGGALACNADCTINDAGCANEDCGTIGDEDGDGDADCADIDCAPFCHEAGSCADNIDNEFDTLIDCADAECVAAPNCVAPAVCGDNRAQVGEQCEDGNNLNGDGCDQGCLLEPNGCAHDLCTVGAPLIDGCDAPHDVVSSVCRNDPSCCDAVNGAWSDACIALAQSFGPDCEPLPESACEDLRDNDNDHMFDCQDPDCQALGECATGDTTAGGPCTQNSDCQATGGDPLCLSEVFGFPGGACSEFCAIADPVCSGDALCLDIGFNNGTGVCIDTCINNADCRTGYECLSLGGSSFCGQEIIEQCANGADDDGNGLVDCDDPDCANAVPCDPAIIAACGAAPLVAGGPFVGDSASGADLFAGSCSGTSAEQLVRFSSAVDGFLQASLSSPTAQSLYIRTNCIDEATEALCLNASPNVSASGEVVVRSNREVTIFIEGASNADAGPFVLTLTFTAASSSEVGLCLDGIDNDLDTRVDCDEIECLVSPECPELSCQDLVDNNNNGLIDCQDPSCQSLGQCVSGSSPISAACDTNSDCLATNGDPSCLPFASGYCSEFCDPVAQDCPGGAICSTIGAPVCIIPCGADTDCAQGQGCFAAEFSFAMCFTIDEFICDDGLDDNNNNLIDCADPGCAGDVLCP